MGPIIVKVNVWEDWQQECTEESHITF